MSKRKSEGYQRKCARNAVGAALDAADELSPRTRVIELKSAEDVRELSPSPYGVFSIVYEGRLIS